MALEPKTRYKPLTDNEMDEFLHWLFDQEGYHNQVEAWREAKKRPADRPTPPDQK